MYLLSGTPERSCQNKFQLHFVGWDFRGRAGKSGTVAMLKSSAYTLKAKIGIIPWRWVYFGIHIQKRTLWSFRLYLLNECWTMFTPKHTPLATQKGGSDPVPPLATYPGCHQFQQRWKIPLWTGGQGHFPPEVGHYHIWWVKTTYWPSQNSLQTIHYLISDWMINLDWGWQCPWIFLQAAGTSTIGSLAISWLQKVL